MASLYTVIVDIAKVGRREIKVSRELWEDIETVVARYFGIAANAFTIHHVIEHRNDPDRR